MGGHLLSDAALAQVREVVRRVLGQASNGRGHRGVPPVREGDLREGVLAGPLAAATNILTGATTATLTVYRGDGAGDLESAGYSIELTNRSLDLAGSTGVYAIARRLNGEWRPIWIDCSPTNEVQAITVEDADGGTLTLALFGVATAGIDHDATAAAVKSALELHPSIDEVTCTGGPLGTDDVLVEFGGSLANTQVPLMVADGSSLTGSDPTVTVAVDTEGCCG